MQYSREIHPQFHEIAFLLMFVRILLNLLLLCIIYLGLKFYRYLYEERYQNEVEAPHDQKFLQLLIHE